MYRVYWVNHDYYSGREFRTLEEAKKNIDELVG